MQGFGRETESPDLALGPRPAAPASLEAQGVLPASCQLLPSLCAAISRGSAHPSAGRSLRAIPPVGLHPLCLPPVPPSPSPPVSCRESITPRLHPCSSRSPNRKPQVPAVSAWRGPALCKGGEAWASAAEGCSVPAPHQEQHQACKTSVLPSLST